MQHTFEAKRSHCEPPGQNLSRMAFGGVNIGVLNALSGSPEPLVCWSTVHEAEKTEPLASQEISPSRDRRCRSWWPRLCNCLSKMQPTARRGHLGTNRAASIHRSWNSTSAKCLQSHETFWSGGKAQANGSSCYARSHIEKMVYGGGDCE